MFGKLQPALAEQSPVIGRFPAAVIIDCSKHWLLKTGAIIMPNDNDAQGV